MKSILGATLFLLLFTHCKKDAVADTVSPGVTILSPADGTHIAAGQDITVTASVVDDKEIEEVHFHVTNKLTSEELVHEHYHPGGKSYDFSGHLTVQSGITYHIEVEAEDKAGNAAEDEIEIIGD
ncbi:MAG: Ig-like domain-containing protein [Flavitalea sp.]